MSSPAETLDTSRSPRRVGYVLKKYPRLSETFILNEILGLEALGVDVTVLSLRLPDEGRFQRDLALVRGDVCYVTEAGSTATLRSFAALRDLGPRATSGLGRALAFLERLPPTRRAGLLVQSLQLAHEVRARGLEHLHAHFMTIAAYAAYLAHLFTGVSFTVTAHAKDVYRSAVDATVFAEIAAAADAVVTVCDANREFIETNLLDGGGRIERVYNGLPLEDLGAGELERRDDLIIGVGRLVEKKGFDVLLEACTILRTTGISFECVIIGDGDQRAELERRRRELGLTELVRFAGALPRHEVVRWMQGARVLASPCVTGEDGNRDALPTVLIEALALGLPSVSTPVGGILEIVDDCVDGFIVDERCPTALASAIEILLADDDLWSAFSSRGPLKARERFDQRQTLPQLVALFGSSRQERPREVVA